MSPGWRDWSGLAAEYASYHRAAGNRACHALGIPLILLALVCWSRVPEGNPVPLISAVWPVYLYWDRRLAAGMAAVLAALSILAPLLPASAAAAAFGTGWLLQLAGHRVFEGRSPAFTRNLLHLLVGPAWILQEALRWRRTF